MNLTIQMRSLKLKKHAFVTWCLLFRRKRQETCNINRFRWPCQLSGWLFTEDNLSKWQITYSWPPQMYLNDQGTLREPKRQSWILHRAHTDTPPHSETMHTFHKGSALNTVKITLKQTPTYRAKAIDSFSSKSLADFYTLKFTDSHRAEWNLKN